MMDRGPMGPTRMELTKPVIAAIEGYVYDDLKVNDYGITHFEA